MNKTYNQFNKEVKKISVITPCFNAEKYIAETIESVLNQTAVVSKSISLEYIICDGSSTDNTVKIIESYKNPSIILISEKDKGMYDALSKGLKIATGDILAYINAGDYYHKCAFEIVVDIFEDFKFVKWLTGFNVAYNEKSHFIGCHLPFKYRKRLFEVGLYGKILPFVQQESIFWRSDLLHHIDLNKLSNFKLAGDYYLWYEFSKLETLYIVQAYLGGFKNHQDQLSANKSEYSNEIEKFILKNKPQIFDYATAILDKIIWHMPNKIKRFLNKKMILRFNIQTNKYEFEV